MRGNRKAKEVRRYLRKHIAKKHEKFGRGRRQLRGEMRSKQRGGFKNQESLICKQIALGKKQKSLSGNTIAAICLCLDSCTPLHL